MKVCKMRPVTVLGFILVASLALVGWKCPGSPLVQVSFVGGPQAGPAPLYAQFHGNVTVLPPLTLDTKFRGGPGEHEQPNPAPQQHQPLVIVVWIWDFGDGTTDTGQDVAHTYTQDGCYDVTLTVVLSNGMSGSLTKPSFVCVNQNRQPVANAGPDQNVLLPPFGKTAMIKGTLPGTEVQLDGSASYDPDGDPLTYQWTFLQWPGQDAKLLPPVPELSDPTSVMPTFVAELAGDYVIQLIVDDGQPDAKVASEPDTVTITATFQNPQ